MNLCKNCRHVKRGTAIDLRETSTLEYQRKNRVAPNSSRPHLQGGDYICTLVKFGPSPIDPVTGFQALPRAGDCRDLNTDGNCSSFAAAGLLSRLFR